MAYPPRIAVAGGTDVGMVRTNNEDAWIARSGGPDDKMTGLLAVVCDGMGGHAGGEIASAVAVQMIVDTFFGTAGDPAGVFALAYRAANSAVNAQAVDPRLKGLGTTAVAAYVRDSSMIVANLGDSRAYLARGNDTRQITNDHSFVAEQVRLGLLDPADAERHPFKNVITRSLGQDRDVTPDLYPIDLEPGDRVILCSDGLSNLVSATEIGQASRRFRPTTAVERLIALANSRGGTDNITVIIIAAGSAARTRPEATRSLLR